MGENIECQIQVQDYEYKFILAHVLIHGSGHVESLKWISKVLAVQSIDEGGQFNMAGRICVATFELITGLILRLIP